jgi:tetratricopeptide (TPR) repeat protein
MVTMSTASFAQVDDSNNDSAAGLTRAETAAARHRAGVAAYARGRYRDAIDLFLEANRLRPSAALLFNVARCYEQLDDPSSALAWYRDYLQRSEHRGDDKQVARRVARLEKRLAQKGVQQVTVDSSPRGATVSIDGDPVGVSPWTGNLKPGSHSVELTLRGFDDSSYAFDLPPDHALNIDLPLSPARPSLAPPPPLGAERSDVVKLRRAPLRQRGSTAKAPPKPEQGSALTTLGWIGLGTGGAALGTALVFEVLRRGAEKDAQREPRQLEFAQDIERMRSRQTLALVFAGASAPLVIVGGMLLLVRPGRSERAPDTRVAFSCTPLQCGASVGGRF